MMQLPVPFSWIVFFLAIVFAVIRYLQLRWRDQRREAGRSVLRQQLDNLYAQIQKMPAPLPSQPAGIPDGWCYRQVPELTTDHRLLLLHEDAPRQRLPRFPGEEEARLVLFADGRSEMFTESAFEQLLVGDNVLRGRLDLPELDIHGTQE
jgi:hypothetical protein